MSGGPVEAGRRFASHTPTRRPDSARSGAEHVATVAGAGERVDTVGTVDDQLHERKRRVTVAGRSMAYLETGREDGDPIVFLHGNPTSSYLWRNVLPHAEPLGRCIAPDLIGMGDSDKLEGEGDERYRFVRHRAFLDGFLDAVGVRDRVTLVVHDWGSGLGFDWANRHRDAVKGIAYMEAICGVPSLTDWPESGRDIFRAMRSEAGERICLEKNVFVERVLPSSVIRDLSDEAMEHYRAPFREPGEDRRPTLTWPRQIPFDGEPADTAEIVEDYRRWLSTSDVPKLYVHTTPGFLSKVFADECRTWRNQTEVTVKGIHFVQEDSPDDIGRALADWYPTLG